MPHPRPQEPPHDGPRARPAAGARDLRPTGRRPARAARRPARRTVPGCAASHLADAGPESLAVTGVPKVHSRQIWSTNPQEQLNTEIRRRTDVVGTFPDRASVLRLVGAVAAETYDEWADTRRYLTPDALRRPDPVTEPEQMPLTQAAPIDAQDEDGSARRPVHQFDGRSHDARRPIRGYVYSYHYAGGSTPRRSRSQETWEDP